MLIEKILEEAQPYLLDRKIKDAVIGLSLIGIELDNGDIGLAYMLREHLPPGCSVFGFAQDIIGADAYEIAQLAKSGDDDAKRGVGMAVLTAGSRQLELVDSGLKDNNFGLKVNAEDVVGMIGFIPPIASNFSKQVKELIIFDEGISRCENGKNELIQPIEKQKELLPNCDIVIISGTSFINHTIDSLLQLCSGAREIILIGASTPMYPKAFINTNISVLAGSWWDNGLKDSLFKKISLSGGIHHIQDAMIKKNINIRKNRII